MQSNCFDEADTLSPYSEKLVEATKIRIGEELIRGAAENQLAFMKDVHPVDEVDQIEKIIVGYEYTDVLPWRLPIMRLTLATFAISSDTSLKTRRPRRSVNKDSTER